MSEYGHNPEEAKESQEMKELLKLQSRLPEDYLVYGDLQEEKGEKNLPATKEFLEFIKDLNPAYLKFFNQLLEQNLTQANPDNKKGFDNKEIQGIWVEYERKLEFLRTNYSLPITDGEAVQALTFLNKEQNSTIEIAQKKVDAWRKLSAEWGYPEGKIIYLARAGFTLEETAPAVRDEKVEYKKDEDKKGLCYKDFKHLQAYDPDYDSTTDEVRFFIPRRVPHSTNLTIARQATRIDEIAADLIYQCPQLGIRFTMGEANQIANQILVHYNQTGERTPLSPIELNYVRTLTHDVGGYRLSLGGFDVEGLRCDSAFRDGNYPRVGVFTLGVEKIPKQK